MLYETLWQPTIFLYMTLAGFACGFLFDLKNILVIFFHKNKILSQILLFFTGFFTLFFSFFVNLKTNYGEIRFFSMAAFILAFSIERFFALNFLAKPIAKCYNKIKGQVDERRTRRKESENKNPQIE